MSAAGFFIEALIADVRADLVKVASDLVVDLSIDPIAGVTSNVLTRKDVGVLVDVDLNTFSDVITVFGFGESDQSRIFCC